MPYAFCEQIGKKIRDNLVEIPFELPESWEWCRLGDILLKLTDGTHSTPKYTESGVPFISVQENWIFQIVSISQKLNIIP